MTENNQSFYRNLCHISLKGCSFISNAMLGCCRSEKYEIWRKTTFWFNNSLHFPYISSIWKILYECRMVEKKMWIFKVKYWLCNRLWRLCQCVSDVIVVVHTVWTVIITSASYTCKSKEKIFCHYSFFCYLLSYTCMFQIILIFCMTFLHDGRESLKFCK